MSKAIADYFKTQPVLKAWLFGSYARGEATPESDIDFRVDRGDMKDLLSLGDLFCDLEDGFDKKLDVLTTQMLSPAFLQSIRPEEVLIYAHDCLRRKHTRTHFAVL